MNCENIGCWRDWKGIVWDCVGEKIEPFTRFTLRCEVCSFMELDFERPTPLWYYLAKNPPHKVSSVMPL